MNQEFLPFEAAAIDFAKADGLVPAVVQDARSGQVLMLGYMNRGALDATLESRSVTFWSRSKQRLWTKGESSGHVLKLVSIAGDCDADALLVLADPVGPTCHRGCSSCFDPSEAPLATELARLDATIAKRLRERPA